MNDKRILLQSSFNRPTLTVARELLGKYLVRRINGKIIALPINEVEVYDGFNDRASHAFRGRTPRNSIMFEEAGYWYVYFCYGMHWMLNIVTGPRDYPAAILIRGAGEHVGPGRLTKALKIDGSINRRKLGYQSGLWIEDRQEQVSNRQIVRTPRIGVLYAGDVWAAKPYRFVLKEKRRTN